MIARGADTKRRNDSMLQAMYSGISAIEAHQERMDIIGNNIANVNTTAYKSGRVTFQDQLSQTLQGAGAPTGNVGGTNPQQVGLGVRVGSIDTLMSQGGLQSTTRPTDMAIQGNGYFMLGDSTGVSYTRDGSFSLDSSGALVSGSDGSYVLGWKADANGKIDSTKQIGPASHVAIPVGDLTAVQPTSNVTFAGNLSADSVPADTYSRSVVVYDSLGEKQTVSLTFQRDAAAADPSHTWKWAASGDAAAAGGGSITFDSTGKETGATGAITLNPADGATQAQAVTPDFTGITQISGSSSASPSTQNGFGPGTLQSFSVDQTGAVTGIFNNGLTRVLGQVALADFPNPGGLERAGGNAFRTTINSGLPSVGTALSGSLGKISTGYLEQSNVDLSTEFTNMIVTQRGFQANTKIITTVDDMLNDIIQAKR